MPWKRNGRWLEPGKKFKIWCDRCENAEAVIRYRWEWGFGGGNVTLCAECHEVWKADQKRERLESLRNLRESRKPAKRKP